MLLHKYTKFCSNTLLGSHVAEHILTCKIERQGKDLLKRFKKCVKLVFGSRTLLSDLSDKVKKFLHDNPRSTSTKNLSPCGPNFRRRK